MVAADVPTLVVQEGAARVPVVPPVEEEEGEEVRFPIARHVSPLTVLHTGCGGGGGGGN